MQFRLPTSTPDATALAGRLQPIDPFAQITLDAKRGVLEVLSSASSEQIVQVLEQLGCEAEPLEKLTHISGGSTCCGGCA